LAALATHAFIKLNLMGSWLHLKMKLSSLLTNQSIGGPFIKPL
jgi:hypothetical protein